MTPSYEVIENCRPINDPRGELILNLERVPSYGIPSMYRLQWQTRGELEYLDGCQLANDSESLGQ